MRDLQDMVKANDNLIDKQRTKISASPHDHLLHLELGDMLMDAFEFEEAILAYQRVRELRPDIDIRLRIGHAYVCNSQYDVGLPILLEAAKDKHKAHADCILVSASSVL